MSLTLAEVSFRYGSRDVLNGCTLCIEGGEVVAVVGPSGSGKSTLLAIAGGLLSPSSGDVRLFDDDLRHRSTTGWIFQGSNVLPRRTALDNVVVAALAQGHRRRESLASAYAALDTVGLRERAAEPVNLLSGGELQRVCVARLLLAAPRLVLADEPTGHLDRRNSALVMDALISLRSTERVVIVATHDLDVAAVADRVITLADGRVSHSSATIRPPL